MAPSAVDSSATDSGPPNIPPPHLHPVKEAHFESFLSPQPDGYQQAVSQGYGKVAIVIDNGTPRDPALFPALLPKKNTDCPMNRILSNQGWLVF